MSFKNRDAQIPMARCKKCDSDLVISRKSGGYIFCTSMKCVYVRKPHPTGPEANAGTDK